MSTNKLDKAQNQAHKALATDICFDFPADYKILTMVRIKVMMRKDNPPLWLLGHFRQLRLSSGQFPNQVPVQPDDDHDDGDDENDSDELEIKNHL